MKLHMHQFLSRTGKFRTKAELISAIESGSVRLDEDIIRNPMYRFNPKKKKVYYNGQELCINEEKVYLLVNKPVGYISGRVVGRDAKAGKKSIYELLDKIEPETRNTLFCVGRLDEDSSGLIIMTSDGKLGYKITNPNSRIRKTYYAELKNPLDPRDAEKIEKGIEITDENKKYLTRPSQIKMQDNNRLFITLTEGKKREVRRMFEAVGNQVIKLERVAIGNIKLDLKPGEVRRVKKEEIIKRL